ncbi:hypothetical protein [Aneurinibacillus terranovensis]|nr:hypothetical protein [Aneurinibacillus terranovensis]
MVREHSSNFADFAQEVQRLVAIDKLDSFIGMKDIKKRIYEC